jgi:hypothetical protein
MFATAKVSFPRLATLPPQGSADNVFHFRQG